ncbi:unnamed protein product [Paramecium pentaurelia]|uniref:Uncharacterized protein n=1 Tax=Paramecium pentaurelia TaxID=43138 RepID=A0A8S1SG76_9CILI|nr:unnamed protein product [Paramecium pentaurelia]
MEQLQTIQSFYDQLIKELEKKFEEKLSQLNKRYHVMETSLKQKIKLLEAGKHQKSEDLEKVKLKAKIFSLEKQLQQLESRDNILHRSDQKSTESQAPQEVFLSVLDSVFKQLGNNFEYPQFLYPQIDSLIPNLIEILPTSLSLLSDMTFLLFKTKFYHNFLAIPHNKQLQEDRIKLKSIEQHVNEIMFCGGCHQNFEICFNPQTEEWKKKILEKEIDKPIVQPHTLQLTQSTIIQNYIIKAAKQKLESTYTKVIRDNNQIPHLNFYQQLKQKHVLFERLNCVILILILSFTKDNIIYALNNITQDLRIDNQILLQQLIQQIHKKDLDMLILFKLKDYGSDIELQYASVNYIQELNKKGIKFPQSEQYLKEHIKTGMDQELIQMIQQLE